MNKSAKDNKNLSEYVRRSLQVERFGEPYATLIVEVFVRMQYVLNLSPEEFREDINNFSNSVFRFRFDHLKEKTMGITDQYNKEIVFNSDYWQKIMNNFSQEDYSIKFFETFAHECLHGMQNIVDKNGNLHNRAEGKNKKVKNRSHAIYEICTQATAAKMARNRSFSEYQSGKTLTGDGYSDEIFAVPLISSTFGISEQEILKYGLREKEKLITILDKNIRNRNYTELILQKIEDELEIIHSIGYPDLNQKKYIKMSDEKKKAERTESILRLTEICQEVFANRIKCMPLDIDNKEITKFKFDQKKMLDTLRNEFNYYGQELNKNFNQMYYQATGISNSAIYIRNSLNVLSEIAKDKYGIYSSNRVEFIDYIKRGNFELIERILGNNIDIDRSETQFLVNQDFELRDEILHKDYNSLIDWDNSEIEDAIFGRIKQDNSFEIKSSIKNWDEERINSSEGERKKQALFLAARETSKKYNGHDMRYTFFAFLKSNPYELEKVYSQITRNNDARDKFKEEFCTDDDKEFLAKLFALKYVEKIYDFEKNVPKEIQDKDNISSEIRTNLIPTLQKNGKSNAIWAISKVILQGNYEAISRGNIDARRKLELISPDSFLSTISDPLMDEIMQKRTISTELEDAVRFALYITESKYPKCISSNLNRFINDYLSSGVFNYRLFSHEGRENFSKQIKNKEDLEDLIGVLCNDFTERAQAEQNISQGVTGGYNNYFQNISVNMGVDAFREAMIKAIIDKDFSLFSPDAAQLLSNIDKKLLLECLTFPTIQKENSIENRTVPINANNVSTNDLRENAKTQKPSIISSALDNLKGIFRSESNKSIGDNSGR